MPSGNRKTKPVSTAKRKSQRSVSINGQTYARLKAVMAESRMSISDLVSKLINAKLDELEKVN